MFLSLVLKSVCLRFLRIEDNHYEPVVLAIFSLIEELDFVLMRIARSLHRLVCLGRIEKGVRNFVNF
jgi:hypothetical protein